MKNSDVTPWPWETHEKLMRNSQADLAPHSSSTKHASSESLLCLYLDEFWSSMKSLETRVTSHSTDPKTDGVAKLDPKPEQLSNQTLNHIKPIAPSQEFRNSLSVSCEFHSIRFYHSVFKHWQHTISRLRLLPDWEMRWLDLNKLLPMLAVPCNSLLLVVSSQGKVS